MHTALNKIESLEGADYVVYENRGWVEVAFSPEILECFDRLRKNPDCFDVFSELPCSDWGYHVEGSAAWEGWRSRQVYRIPILSAEAEIIDLLKRFAEIAQAYAAIALMSPGGTLEEVVLGRADRPRKLNFSPLLRATPFDPEALKEAGRKTSEIGMTWQNDRELLKEAIAQNYTDSVALRTLCQKPVNYKGVSRSGTVVFLWDSEGARKRARVTLRDGEILSIRSYRRVKDDDFVGDGVRLAIFPGENGPESYLLVSDTAESTEQNPPQGEDAPVLGAVDTTRQTSPKTWRNNLELLKGAIAEDWDDTDGLDAMIGQTVDESLNGLHTFGFDKGRFVGQTIVDGGEIDTIKVSVASPDGGGALTIAYAPSWEVDRPNLGWRGNWEMLKALVASHYDDVEFLRSLCGPKTSYTAEIYVPVTREFSWDEGTKSAWVVFDNQSIVAIQTYTMTPANKHLIVDTLAPTEQNPVQVEDSPVGLSTDQTES